MTEMSEKRFYLGNNGTTICDRSQGGSDGFNMLIIFEVVDLLNKFYEENGQLRKKYDNLYSAIEKTARDMAEKRIYEMEDFDVFQRITDYVEELDE